MVNGCEVKDYIGFSTSVGKIGLTISVRDLKNILQATLWKMRKKMDKRSGKSERSSIAL